MRNKTKITLTLLILLGFGALNTFAQDEPYMIIGSGHGGYVRSVAFSPDGNTLASGSDAIRIWDVKAGAYFKMLTGHTSGVNSVAFSPDGNTLASASADRTIRLWHVQGAPTPNEPMRTTISLSKSSGLVAPGKAFKLSATLENTGAIAAPSTLQFYGPVKVVRTTVQATSGTLPAIDFTGKTLGKPIDIAAMDADSTRKETITATASETAGTYAYKACIQRTNGAGGTDEICSDVFTVTVAPPDLQFTKAWAEPATVAPGATFKLYATVSNSGGKSDETTLWWYYLRNDDGPEEPEELQGTRIDPLPTVEGKVIVTKHITVTAPEEPGTYSYRLSIDNVDGEENRENNSSDFEITVGEPDLVIESVLISSPENETNKKEGPISVAPGDKFNLHVAFKNIGTPTSKKAKGYYYRSANAVISETDILIASSKEGFKLPENDRFSRVLRNITAPDTPGSYYYGVCIDKVEGETNTDNNCKFIKVKVTVGSSDEIDKTHILSMSPNFISDIAYTTNYTYFVLNPQYLKVQNLDNDKVTNKVCVIKLTIDGVAEDAAGLGDVAITLGSLLLQGEPTDARLENPGYYMFPIQTPAEKLKEWTEDSAINVTSLAIGYIPIAGDIIGAAQLAGQAYMDVREILKGTANPRVILSGPSTPTPILFLIPKRIERVGVSVEQVFNYEGFSRDTSLLEKLTEAIKSVINKVTTIQTWVTNILIPASKELPGFSHFMDFLKEDKDHDLYAVYENE